MLFVFKNILHHLRQTLGISSGVSKFALEVWLEASFEAHINLLSLAIIELLFALFTSELIWLACFELNLVAFLSIWSSLSFSLAEGDVWLDLKLLYLQHIPTNADTIEITTHKIPAKATPNRIHIRGKELWDAKLQSNDKAC